MWLTPADLPLATESGGCVIGGISDGNAVPLEMERGEKVRQVGPAAAPPHGSLPVCEPYETSTEWRL